MRSTPFALVSSPHADRAAPLRTILFANVYLAICQTTSYLMSVCEKIKKRADWFHTSTSSPPQGAQSTALQRDRVMYKLHKQITVQRPHQGLTACCGHAFISHIADATPLPLRIAGSPRWLRFSKAPSMAAAASAPATAALPVDTTLNPLVASVKPSKTMALTDLATSMKESGIDVRCCCVPNTIQCVPYPSLDPKQLPTPHA